MTNSWPNLEEARAALRDGTGKGIKVAVLDSGVEAGSAALQGAQLADDLAVVEDDVSLVTVDGGARDVFGHGTAVAGIIRQVAPEAQLGSFRVLGEQLRSRSAIIREAARQALERGYHILNCSFGCGREEHVLLFKDWVDEAYVRGAHVVAACNNYDFRRREWPSHFPSVIAVNLSPAPLPTTYYYWPGHLVEFGALGLNIEVYWLGGARKKVSGSSFAAPHLAGLLARMLSRMPGLNPLEAKALLRKLATPEDGLNNPG